MTRRQRDEAVEAHADLILAEEPWLKAYAAHFEAQMHRGKAHRLLSACCRWLARVGALLRGVRCGHEAGTELRSA